MHVRFIVIGTLFWAVFVLLMLSTPRSASAAEWTAQPSIRAGLEYNDNPQLTIQPHESVHGSMVAPKLDLSVSSDLWQVIGGMEATRKRYSGNSGLDRDDQVYNLATSFRTERSTWQLAGNRSKSSTISEEQITPDAGLVAVPVTYDSHRISPSWTWALNELTQLQLAYSLTDFSYVNGQSVGLHDYSTRAVTAQLVKNIDFKNQVFFSAGYSIFNVPSTNFQSKSSMYQAGITRSFSSTTKGTLSAGARKTSSEQESVVCTVLLAPSLCLQHQQTIAASKNTSSVFSGSLEKKYETVYLNLSVNRAFDPSGLGVEVRTDSQTANLGKQFTARLRGNLSASNYSYSSQAADVGGIKRHFYTFGAGLSWMWTRELNTDFRYQYGHIKRAVEDQAATSNAAYLTLQYQWPKMDF